MLDAGVTPSLGYLCTSQPESRGINRVMARLDCLNGPKHRYTDELRNNKNGSPMRIRTCKDCGFRYFARIKSKKKNKIQIEKPREKVIQGNFYESNEWLKLRYEVIKKYDRRCMVCFRTNISLHVDHIKPRSKYPSLALVESNLQVLCRDCNLGKGNRDEIDWRPKDQRSVRSCGCITINCRCKPEIVL